MAKHKTIDDEELKRLLDEYRLDNPNIKIKIPAFGAYIRHKGYDVKDYTIRRSVGFRDYLEVINKGTEEEIRSDLVTYRSLDVDAFLDNNPTRRNLKEAIIVRDRYYARIAANAVDAIRMRKEIEKKMQTLEKRITELEAALDSVQAKADNADIRKKNKTIAKLKEILDGYIYPDAANAILEKEGVLEIVSSIIPKEQMETKSIKADTEMNLSKYDAVNKLLEGFDG